MKSASEDFAQRIGAGDLDAVEAWLADENVGLQPLARSALESLCRKNRILADAAQTALVVLRMDAGPLYPRETIAKLRAALGSE